MSTPPARLQTGPGWLTMVRMPRLVAACLLLSLLAPAQEIMPSGITCCSEDQIRAAMTEEALQRVASRCLSGPSRDYLTDRASATVRRRLPAGARDEVLAFLRRALAQPAADEETREFQELVGLFVLGMTLEIGHTFQDEYDRALQAREDIGRLLAALEKRPPAGEAELSRAMFLAGITEREMRRIRALDRRWREADDEDPPFRAFNQLKRNATGRAADPDQATNFELAAAYRDRFPFLDEFLANYRRLAADVREAARRVNSLLAPAPG